MIYIYHDTIKDISFYYRFSWFLISLIYIIYIEVISNNILSQFLDDPVYYT